MRPSAREGWRALPHLAARVFRDARKDRLTGLGAEAAFFLLLSLPPALLALLGSIGWVAGLFGEDVTRTIRDQALSVGGNFLSDSAQQDILRPAVDTLLRRGRADVASIGGLLAVWAASRATSRMIEAVGIAYDIKDRRKAWRRRLLALGLTVAAMLAIVVFLPVLVAGPRLLAVVAEPLGIEKAVATAWRFLYWPVVGLLGLAMLATFYHLATPIRTPWRRDLPGAVLAAGLWLVGGIGLRAYAEIAVGSGTYGPLAAPIVFLLWLFVTALAVLLGAELNAEIEKTWPSGAPAKEDADEEPPADALQDRSGPS